MINQIEKVFKIQERNSNIKTELMAGLTTFFTMSYLIILSPKILANTGLALEPTIAITAITVFLCCTIMGLIANRPFAVAPFIGDTAFIAYTLVLTMGISIKTIFASIFIIGLILLIMSITNLRVKIVNLIPETLKLSFCIGLGLFFILISLKDIGIIKFTTNQIPLETGNITSIPVILGLFCLILLISLMKRGIKGAVIIAISLTTILGIIIGDIQLPKTFISLPTNFYASLFQLDFSNILTKDFIPIFFLLFILTNIATAGAVVGVMYKTENPNDIKKPMISDSLATTLAPLLGTTTSGVYMDSLIGMEAGGKTGLTAITVGFLFLTGLFFIPLITIIPPYAYAPVLLYVGIILVKQIEKIDFKDITEYATVIFTITAMTFTYNICVGIILGFIIYPTLKFFCGRKNEINKITWIMLILSCIFLAIYPY